MVQEVLVCSHHKHTGQESVLSNGVAAEQEEAGTDRLPRKRANSPEVQPVMGIGNVCEPLGQIEKILPFFYK